MAGNTVYVQGSYVDVHDNEVVNLTIDKAGRVAVEGNEVQGAVAKDGEATCSGAVFPEVLCSERALGLWQKAQAQGWVDEACQPLLSRPQAALLADRMAEVLGIAQKWKVFEQLWQRKNMRNDYNTAMNQQQCDEYMKKFKRVIV